MLPVSPHLHVREDAPTPNDGSDYEAIQQSYVIRDLRREVEDLKEQLRDAHEGGSSCNYEEEQDIAARATAPSFADAKRRREAESKPLAARKSFISLPSIDHHLRYLEQHVAYPFPSIHVGDNTTAALTRLLPDENEILTSLGVFHDIAQGFVVPQTPDKTRKKEIQRFLSDIERNATKEPDMLALLFASLALVLHMSLIGKRRSYSSETPEIAFARGECYKVSASMQALRNASFMSEPTLVGIKTLLILAVGLARTGRAHSASALFGKIVRLAYSIDLHRDPDVLRPRLSSTERRIRRSLWWLMLHSDQHLSHILCVPLTISSVGDCPQPLSSTSNLLELRIAHVVHEFTLFAREVSTCEQHITAKDRNSKMSKLEALWQSMPETLQFEEANWSCRMSKLADGPLELISARIFADIQYMIILLNRPDLRHPPSLEESCPQSMRTEEEASVTRHSPDNSSSFQPSSEASRKRARTTINACTGLLRAFLFLWNCNTKHQVSHPVESRALTALTILLSSAKRAGFQIDIFLVDEVYSVFLEMHRSGVCRVATFAVEHISRLRM
ncbi:hypothetical protein Q7P37_001019 [Cladosporium fusiforme]